MSDLIQKFTTIMGPASLKSVLLALALAGALGFGDYNANNQNPCLVSEAPDSGSLGTCSNGDEEVDDDADGTCETALADTSCTAFCSGEGSMSYANLNGAESCTCGTGKCCSDSSPADCE